MDGVGNMVGSRVGPVSSLCRGLPGVGLPNASCVARSLLATVEDVDEGGVAVGHVSCGCGQWSRLMESEAERHGRQRQDRFKLKTDSQASKPS